MQGAIQLSANKNNIKAINRNRVKKLNTPKTVVCRHVRAERLTVTDTDLRVADAVVVCVEVGFDVSR